MNMEIDGNGQHEEQTKVSVDSRDYANFLRGFADLANADMDRLQQEEWTEDSLKNAHLYCYLAVNYLAEDAFKLDVFRKYVGTLRRIYWNPSMRTEARLWCKHSYYSIFKSLMPSYDLIFFKRLRASDSPEAVIFRQGILEIYNLILTELKKIKATGAKERIKLMQDFRKRHGLPNSFHIVTPSESAREVINLTHPNKPGKNQLKHILNQARRESSLILHPTNGLVKNAKFTNP